MKLKKKPGEYNSVVIVDDPESSNAAARGHGFEVKNVSGCVDFWWRR